MFKKFFQKRRILARKRILDYYVKLSNGMSYVDSESVAGSVNIFVNDRLTLVADLRPKKCVKVQTVHEADAYDTANILMVIASMGQPIVTGEAHVVKANRTDFLLDQLGFNNTTVKH